MAQAVKERKVYVPHRDALGRFCAMPAGRDGIRGKDRKKFANWVDLRVMHTFDDGVFIGDVTHPDDLALLGRFGGGCSGSHVWNIQKKLEHIMAVFDTDGVAHCVMHMLGIHCAWADVPWKNTETPRTYNNLTYCGSLGNHSPVEWIRGQGNSQAMTIPEMEMRLSDLRRYLEQTIADYAWSKEQALAHGPINRSNPFKADMDYFNRYKGQYLQQISEMEAKIEARKQEPKEKVAMCSLMYRKVLIDDDPFVLITGYNTDKWAEYASDWLDTLPEGFSKPIKHRCLPKPVQVKDMAELRQKVAASGHPEVAWLNRKNTYRF